MSQFEKLKFEPKFKQHARYMSLPRILLHGKPEVKNNFAKAISKMIFKEAGFYDGKVPMLDRDYDPLKNPVTKEIDFSHIHQSNTKQTSIALTDRPPSQLVSPSNFHSRAQSPKNFLQGSLLRPASRLPSRVTSRKNTEPALDLSPENDHRLIRQMKEKIHSNKEQEFDYRLQYQDRSKLIWNNAISVYKQKAKKEASMPVTRIFSKLQYYTKEVSVLDQTYFQGNYDPKPRTPSQNLDRPNWTRDIPIFNPMLTLTSAKKKDTEIDLYSRNSKISESEFPEEFALPKLIKIAWCSVELSQTLPTEILESVVGATMHVHNDRLVIIGGRGSRHSQIYQKNLDIENKTIARPRTIGEIPKGRAFHCAVLWRHLVIVFGGELSVPDAPLNKECLSDTSILNLGTEQWSRPQSVGLMMPGLKCAGYCTMGKFMVVNGGVMSDDSISDETFAFDTGVFKWHRVVTYWDTQIACHTMCPVYNDLDGQTLYNGAKKTLVRRRKPDSKIRIEGIYIFGGKDRYGQPMGGLRILETQNKPWGVIQPKTKGLYPRSRFGHCCHFWALQNYLVIYGGRNDEIYELSGTCVINDVNIL
jgi:hypothetical protein